MGKPLILVTNDDGITAPGLRTLIKIMNQIGDVVVVAPDSPQSGMGHAITISDTLHVKKENIDSGPQTEYSISGTPEAYGGQRVMCDSIFWYPGPPPGTQNGLQVDPWRPPAVRAALTFSRLKYSIIIYIYI